MRSTIAQKGLVMTAIPLVFQVVFLILLCWFMVRAKDAADEFQRSQTMTAFITRCTTVSMSAGLNLAGYVIIGEDNYLHTFKKACTEARHEREFINRKHLVVDPNEMPIWQKYERLNEEYLSYLEETRGLAAAGKMALAKERITGHPSAMDLYFQPYRKATADVLLYEDHQHPGKNLKDAGKNLITFVAAGFVINLLLSGWMLRFFSKEFTLRIQVMMNNAKRFVKGEPLNPTLPGNDEIAELDVVFHDMADAINKSTERLRELIENMLVGLIVVHPDGTIESVNPRSELLFELQAIDLMGENISTLFAETHPITPSDGFALIKDKATNKIAELEGRRQNGETFPVEVTICQLETADGLRFLANILDVSQKKEVERIRREFVSTVTHELRTPLTSVRGGLTLLSAGAMGELPVKARDIVLMAERNTMRLLNLINDLLDIEKMEAGMLQMEITETSLDEVIERSIESIQTFAQNNQVSIVHDPAPFRVTGDKDRLVQVLVNLMSNAVKFSATGTNVEIRVQDHGDEVQLSIVDHGRGIPEEFKPKIFQRFQQSAISDSKQKGGSGLGLAICKTIVELHNGQIGFDSIEGEGSTFWLRIPKAITTDSDSGVVLNLSDTKKQTSSILLSS